MDHNYQPLLILLGSVVRYLLAAVAGVLLAYGATQEQIDAAVDATVAIVISIVITLATLGWSYLSKKAAFETPPTEDK